MANDTSDGQPSIEKLAAEGVSPRKCIASGTDYGSGSSGGSSPPKSGAKPKGALAGMKMKGSGY